MKMRPIGNVVRRAWADRRSAGGLVATLAIALLIIGARGASGAQRPSAGKDSPATIAWAESLDVAMARCGRENKAVFISFSTRRGGDPDAPFF